MKARFLFSLFILFISITCDYTLNDAPILLLIVGMVIGTRLLNIGWLQSISKAWPLTAKVINWKQQAMIVNTLPHFAAKIAAGSKTHWVSPNKVRICPLAKR
jgi:hypothetical protein